MIIATILRNFKCYKGINIIPFSSDIDNGLNVIIGDNGVGKSAILEGMDTLFNEGSWIINNESKTHNDTGVGAFFLIQKEKLNRLLDTREQNIVSEVGNFFWEDMSPSIIYKGYEKLFAIRDSLIGIKDRYYLLVIGREINSPMITFLTFTNNIKNVLSIVPKPNDSTISKLLLKILNSHTYIYIPVETLVSNFVRLQNQSMQSLMDRNIKEVIVKRLNSTSISRKSGKKEKKLSLLDLINETLEEYVNTVENDIQKEYIGYSFKPAPRQSSRLTANHVTDTIIDAYYSKRYFKKDGKSIEHLSSGEKRLILIDIISAFIKKRQPESELIVALDEPENSLHISKCYEQFSKINQIAIDYKHQIFVTTHWYGSLPCLDKGGLIHINSQNKPSFKNIKNYFEERGSLPNDIQLKGYFDLASSLLYAFRNGDKTMILVEGYEDKRYIEYYLDDLNIMVLPLGGCGNVKKVFGYIYTPLCDAEMNAVGTLKKIVCLVDTDVSCTQVSTMDEIKTGILRIVRLHQEEDQSSTLYRNNDNKHNPTEVEDVLEPSVFYNSLSICVSKDGTDEEKAVFSSYKYNTSAVCSRIKGDYGVISPNILGRNVGNDKQIIQNFINNHKDDIAKEYIKTSKTGTVPGWVEKLREICCKPVK